MLGRTRNSRHTGEPAGAEDVSVGVVKRDRSHIFPGMGMGFPLAFAWPCFWRIVKGLTGK